ncbi:Kunitz/Bovine pancreatic trypsin inhibitor domain protein [Ostertagia ostertagi]
MLRPDEGKSCDRTASVRWFFDDLTHSCRSFLFRGCDGNPNNFPVRQMCMEYCSRPDVPSACARRECLAHTRRTSGNSS